MCQKENLGKGQTTFSDLSTKSADSKKNASTIWDKGRKCMLLQPWPAVLLLELEKYERYRRTPKRENLRDGREWQIKQWVLSIQKRQKLKGQG